MPASAGMTETSALQQISEQKGRAGEPRGLFSAQQA
jgi:hypothetical protein